VTLREGGVVASPLLVATFCVHGFDEAGIKVEGIRLQGLIFPHLVLEQLKVENRQQVLCMIVILYF